MILKSEDFVGSTHHEKIILSRRDTFQYIKQVPIIGMYLHSEQCKIIIENIPIE